MRWPVPCQSIRYSLIASKPYVSWLLSWSFSDMPCSMATGLISALSFCTWKYKTSCAMGQTLTNGMGVGGSWCINLPSVFSDGKFSDNLMESNNQSFIMLVHNTHSCVGFISFPLHSLHPSLLPLGSFSQLSYSPKSFCFRLCFRESIDYLISLFLRSLSVKQAVCCCSVDQLCLNLCNPMDCRGYLLPSYPVLHCLREFTQTLVHWVDDAIQPSHLLLPLSPAFSLSQQIGNICVNFTRFI